MNFVVEEARIIMGKSIDGVEVGDSVATVVRKLGQPSEIIYGDFAGFIYNYKQGKFAGLSIMFADAFNNRVVRVLAEAPYSGTTKDGVGIGTTRAIGRHFLGLPDTNRIDAWWQTFGEGAAGDVYLYGSVAFVFSYVADEVKTIWMLLRF
jgi:hypothetical protein